MNVCELAASHPYWFTIWLVLGGCYFVAGMMGVRPRS